MSTEPTSPAPMGSAVDSGARARDRRRPPRPFSQMAGRGALPWSHPYRRVTFESATRAAAVVLMAGLTLTACAAKSPAAERPEPAWQDQVGGSPASATPQPDAQAPVNDSGPVGTTLQDLSRSDSQGAVGVVVGLRGWSRDAEGTIEFDITMETHSVDLSMDLAALSTLETDAGVSVSALDWTGGSGHHVSGVLRFPAASQQGQPLLEGASLLILTIRDVDAPSRLFQWDAALLP